MHTLFIHGLLPPDFAAQRPSGRAFDRFPFPAVLHEAEDHRESSDDGIFAFTIMLLSYLQYEAEKSPLYTKIRRAFQTRRTGIFPFSFILLVPGQPASVSFDQIIHHAHDGVHIQL
ncbi:MAG: hypothetical protein SOX38_04290, partial [Candidatus Limiplasma sp.]|nr:hypothetical protein [Candidatus Limiplasma sp.]